MTWKFRPFPRVNISVKIIFIIRTKNREDPQFSRHYDNNAVNIGENYFHNEDLSECWPIFTALSQKTPPKTHPHLPIVLVHATSHQKSNFHFEEYQFFGLKFVDFPLLNLFETLSDVISSPKPLASEEFDSFYNNGDQYRPVSLRAIKKFKISGTISFNWKITLIEQTKIYKNNFAPHYSSFLVLKSHHSKFQKNSIMGSQKFSSQK